MQIWQKQLEMAVPESDSIESRKDLLSPESPATTMPVVFVPLNYMELSKGIGSRDSSHGQVWIRQIMHPLLFTRDQLQFHCTILSEFNTWLGKFSCSIWKQSNLHSPNLHRALLCSLRPFSEVDSASASQKASDWLLRFSQVHSEHQTEACALLVLI